MAKIAIKSQKLTRCFIYLLPLLVHFLLLVVL